MSIEYIPKDYDLFVLEPVSTIASATVPTPLTYYGQYIPGTSTPFAIVTPSSYVQKVNKLVLTNLGVASVITLVGVSIASLPTLVLFEIEMAATSSITMTKDMFAIILPPSYYLAGLASAGTAYVVANAYFVAG